MGQALVMAECAVLYLDRWGNEPRFARAFLSSLSRFDAGVEYDFVYILKGYPKEQSCRFLDEFKREVNPKTQVLALPDDRFATATMLQAAKLLPNKKMIYFVSSCRILAPQWLRFYLNAFDAIESCGIAGATSGYECTNKSPPFPNIGIRSTSFVIDRKLFIELADGNLNTREDEGAFESGPDGMTKQIMRRNLKPVVVDNKGKIWHIEEWPYSYTFRSGHQENLLVADKRTYHYAVGSHRRRRHLADINWGPGVADVPSVPVHRRLKLRLDWHRGL
jgi:hypothetical protein